MGVVAIDQGTTSTRALVLNEDGARVVKAVEHRQIYPQPGWVEHDPEELIANIVTCVEAAGAVDAAGIDNQGESCLAWHADTKEALSPVIVWQDNRTQDAIDCLASDGAEDLTLERAGLPLDSYFSASKLAWIANNIDAASDALKAGKLCLGTTDAFFLDRLTGHCVTDITTASRTSLMNLETGDWDDDLCALFSVPRETLPEIVPTTGDFGSIAADSRNIPVTASIVDQQAALYGHGCRKPGDAKITFGTGAFALVVTGADIHRAPEMGLLPTVAWQKRGAQADFALDGGVYSAASAVNWAKSLGLFSAFDEINAFDGPSAIERGIAFVPALSGLACPHWDRSARGTWLGLSLETTPRDMVRALLEGVAFRAAEVLATMAERVELNGAISIDGGMAANPYFLQFLADVTDRELSVPESGELTALGAAMLAAETAGISVAPPSGAHTISPEKSMDAHRDRFAQAVVASRAWGG